MNLLCEKYRASCFADIKGQDIAIKKLELFIKNFPEKKAIILSGPAGTGKTTLAHVLALELNAEILELNASDFRNKENIDNILGQAVMQSSLTKKTKIILADEVDGISGYEDKGGVTALAKLIDDSNFPIIMTSNDIWDKKFADLRKKAEIIELKELGYKIILEILKEIALKENIIVSEDLLTSIAIKSRGDMRAALNDLQTINQETTHQDLSERDKEEKIFSALQKVFKNIPNKEVIDLFDKVNMPLDEIFLWLEENIPSEYNGEELARAYEALSKADVFRGRIIRQQHWRFLIYQNLFLSAGVSASKKANKTGFTIYKKPSRILKIWMINQKNIMKKSIAAKYAEYCHISKKRAMHDFNLIRPILSNPNTQAKLNLSEEEIAFLTA